MKGLDEGIFDGLNGQGWMRVYMKGLDEGIFDGLNGQGLVGYI